MEYAARDAFYLVPLANFLEKELEEKGRLSWVWEECDDLSKVRAAESDSEPLYLKFKGSGRLSPRSLAVLELLLQFRKELAEKKDRPLFKIFGNDSLLRIARAKPRSLAHLERLNAVSRKQMGMYGSELVEIVKKAMEIPEEYLPLYPHKNGPVLSPEVPERVKSLKRWRDAKAQKLRMDPALICNKSLISTLSVKNPGTVKELEELQEMKKWQQKAFGKEIIEVLRKER